MHIRIRNMDLTIILIPILLVILGMITFYFINPPNSEILIRQSIFIVLGLSVMYIGAIFDYRIFRNNSAPTIMFYLFSMVLLLLTFTSQAIRGAQAWTTIFGIQFEPSELVKLATIIVLAKYFSQKHVEIYNAKHIIISGFYAGLPAIIALFQSDFGSTIVFFAIWISVLLFGGINKKHLLGLIIISVVVASAGWFLALRPYQQNRLISFLNPYKDPSGAGFHVIQAQTTFGSGKMFGTVFEGREKDVSVSVPEPYTDFVFSAFGQKFGLVGTMILLSLFAILLLRIGKISSKIQNNFAKLFALGFMAFIFTHIVINVGMNLGLMPITGIPLPFVSQGGSHLITLFLGIGIIQSMRLRT